MHCASATRYIFIIVMGLKPIAMKEGIYFFNSFNFLLVSATSWMLNDLAKLQ